MTSLEQQERFLLLYDKVTNFDAPGYEDEEITAILTKAQERVFFNYYHTLGNKYQEGFEATEARRKDLKELVKGVTLNTPITTSENLPNGVFFTLPQDCLFAISEEVTLVSSDPCYNNKRIRIKPITHDEYSINKHNPFKNPDENIAWRLDYQNQRHEIITAPNTTVGEYHLRYIKRLNPIITGAFTFEGVAGPLDCELDPILHERIVDEAVRIATAVTDPQQYQIKTIEQKEGE